MSVAGAAVLKRITLLLVGLVDLLPPCQLTHLKLRPKSKGKGENSLFLWSFIEQRVLYTEYVQISPNKRHEKLATTLLYSQLEC